MYKKCFLEWYTCVLHEPITHDVQGRQGMAIGQGRLLGKDDSCKSLWSSALIYLSIG